MKRSEINAIMRSADAFIRSHGFHLPPFAYWTPDDWTHKGPEVREIVEHMLGWDITDFGQGNFAKTGLFLFTVRNGSPEALRTGKGKPYAEKIMIVDENQVTPMHFHWSKMEDIINRGGGRLAIQVYNATPAEDLDHDNPVILSVDGVERILPGRRHALPASRRKRHPVTLQLSQLLGRGRAHPGGRGLCGQR